MDMIEPKLRALLDRLHAQSEAQDPALGAYFSKRFQAGDFDRFSFDDDANRFLADKFVALERDKAEFCYLMCRSLGARRVVEAGTSFGVSTLYLAAAIKANGGGVVIGTEYEPKKAAAARALFAEAGLSDVIDLREGDLRETLRDPGGKVDFMLVDIWVAMARPALELVSPFLRPGAAVVCDNTGQFAEAYADYFAFIRDPANRFATQTLPFQGGLEFSVKLG
jgi:predicted O-methyltransferase YrrM